MLFKAGVPPMRRRSVLGIALALTLGCGGKVVSQPRAVAEAAPWPLADAIAGDGEANGDATMGDRASLADASEASPVDSFNDVDASDDSPVDSFDDVDASEASLVDSFDDAAAGPTCGPSNCSGCCDALGNCVRGLDGTECGTGARRCIDCLALGDQCDQGTCTAPDGATLCSQTCSGCCDANGNCQTGEADSQCGDLGRDCEDCTRLTPPSMCFAAISPRACTSQQTICPGVYTGCPSALQQMVPVPQTVCSAGDLMNADMACADGAQTDGCSAFFASSLPSPACLSCLQPFAFDFVQQAGILACVAPFVDATCNHNSACTVDCIAQSCSNCPDTTLTILCDTQVPSGTCSTFASDACVSQALGGSAIVCNPSTYQGKFGDWLLGVGSKYCSM